MSGEAITESGDRPSALCYNGVWYNVSVRTTTDAMEQETTTSEVIAMIPELVLGSLLALIFVVLAVVVTALIVVCTCFRVTKKSKVERSYSESMQPIAKQEVDLGVGMYVLWYLV